MIWLAVPIVIVTLLSIHEYRLARKNREWHRRWEIRQAEWEAGDRRPR